MQKKLIALAIAGLASSAAFAQSNVTVYGVADLTFESVSATGATLGASKGNFTRTNSNSSYVGFKGTEDLGDGLKAVFQIETTFTGDTGVWSASGRDSYVGLAGGFGTVVLGNLTGPTRAIGNRMEVLPGNTGIGNAVSLLANPLNGIASTGTTGTFDTRLPSTVAYISPTFNGFNVILGYSSGENKTNNNAAAGAALNTKTFDLGVNYVNGPIDLGFAHGKVDSGSNSLGGGATIGTGVDEIKNNRFGAAYNFGVAKVTFQYNKQTIDFGNGTDIDAKSYSLQGSFNVSSSGALIGSYTVAKDLTGNNAAVAGISDNGAKLVTVGYLHNLSKRTTVKAIYSRLSNDKNAAYNFASGGVTGTGAFGAGADPKGLALGIDRKSVV